MSDQVELKAELERMRELVFKYMNNNGSQLYKESDGSIGFNVVDKHGAELFDAIQAATLSPSSATKELKAEHERLREALILKTKNECFFHPDDPESGHPDLDEYISEHLDGGHNYKVGDKIKVTVGSYHDIELTVTKAAYLDDEGDEDHELEYTVSDPVADALRPSSATKAEGE